MRHILLVLGLCLAWAIPMSISAQVTVFDYQYQSNVGTTPMPAYVNWAKQAVFITTQGTAPVGAYRVGAREKARAAALDAARREVLSAVYSLRLTGYATVANLVGGGFVPAADVAAVAEGIRPVAERWDPSTHQMTASYVLPLWGENSLGGLVTRMLGVEQQAIEATGKPVAYQAEQLKLRAEPASQPAGDGPYTGIVLDCTGFAYTPVLLPKLIAPDGTEVWGTAGIDRHAAGEVGLAGFAVSVDAAKESGRVGDHPLVLRPLGTAGPLRGDLVVNAEDAALLAERADLKALLASHAVVLLIK